MAEFSLLGAALTIGGHPIQGFGESDAVGWKDTVPERTKVKPCCDGGEVVVRELNRSKDVTVTLRHESPAIPQLETLMAAWTSFSVGLTIPTESGVISFNAAPCKITKGPEPKFGKEVGDFVYEIHCPNASVRYPAGTV